LTIFVDNERAMSKTTTRGRGFRGGHAIDGRNKTQGKQTGEGQNGGKKVRCGGGWSQTQGGEAAFHPWKKKGGKGPGCGTRILKQ